MAKFCALVSVLILLGGASAAGQARCTLDFPDVSGKIVAREKDSVTRLIDSAVGGAKTAQARFFIHADRPSCWRVVTDYDHYPEFMPNIKSATRVGRSDGTDVFAYTLKALLWTVSYTLEMKSVRLDSAWTLSWSYVKGDLKSTSGSWEFYECPETPGVVLACYTVRVDVGGFVPGFLSNHLMTGSVPKLISAVRARAEGKNTVGKH